MHGAYAANMAVNECDLLFSIGTRFNDRITGKLHSFAPHAQIVHIDIDTAAISRERAGGRADRGGRQGSGDQSMLEHGEALRDGRAERPR